MGPAAFSVSEMQEDPPRSYCALFADESKKTWRWMMWLLEAAGAQRVARQGRNGSRKTARAPRLSRYDPR